ncbi:ATP-binding protein [Sphingomonas sp. LB3N6]|uniref:sensor histidine kinase n=1 Tax=Sphingomonas fucosidasi TaxID=3096164 RepID=UPI002FC7F35D
MTRAWVTQWRWLAATVLLAALAATIIGLVARDRARGALARRVGTDATLRAALFDSEVARFRLLPVALRDDRDVVAAVRGDAAAIIALDRKLERLAGETGAAAIYAVGRSGTAIAASNWRSAHSFVGTDYRFRRYVRDAVRTGSASQFARGTVSGRPGLYLSQRAAEGGVVVVKLEFDRVEADWAKAGGDTYVRDPNGLVLVSSRPQWRFAITKPLSPPRLAAVRIESSLPATTLQHLPGPAEMVADTVATTQPGWTLTARRRPEADARFAERTASAVAAIIVAAISALAWGFRQRRLLQRRRTADLEEAVAARTAELTREIEERAASEARAIELREGLRQANRLATLGQVTASVAHETAQPVAAIRNYAAVSATLLRRGNAHDVLENLEAIARLADRIGTVTAELRGFSRRRTGPVRAVSLAEVVDGALLILREQLRAVAGDRPVIDPAVMVRGGRVRLEQVLVNILQNALEAVRERADPRIDLHLRYDSETVVLTVDDNGPGLAHAVRSRLFTPFVTSRPEGLGLGLVIAHDIMLEFGGTLRHADTPVGARFEIVIVIA